MLHIGTRPFETTRLICRPFLPEDHTNMLENWIADPAVQSEYGEPVYSTPAAVKALLSEWLGKYLSPDFYRWAIVEKASGKNIGQIAFCKVYPELQTAEIEYCIGQAFWGNGYAGEALSALIDFIFQQGDFIKLEAYHRAKNIRSGRVLEKSVMKVTDTVERFRRENTLPHGEVCYCIHRDAVLSPNISSAM